MIILINFTIELGKGYTHLSLGSKKKFEIGKKDVTRKFGIFEFETRKWQIFELKLYQDIRPL